MTASAVATPPRPAVLTRIASAVRARSAEALVFSGAAVVALLHAFDDAFLFPRGGVPLTQHALAFGIALVASVVAAARFSSLRPGLRAAVAFTFGVLAAVNGGRHAHHIVIDGGATGHDVTGVLALVAGVAMVGLAVWIPFRHRGEGASGPVRRWAIRVLVLPVFALSVVFFFGPVGMAVVDIHSMPRPIGSPPDAAYKTVGFTASDGVDLEGWYRPSQNGASVLMISGGGGNRRSTLRHAKMLARNGYGVLLYDPRGSGHSEGTINSYGWGWEKDAAAALDFLAKRDDVDPGRVGVLGLSTGGDIAIDIAARRADVKAVVADGTAAIGYEDIKEYTPKTLDRAPMYVLFKAIEVIQGRPGPKASLADQIARSTAPHLLVSAGKPEKEWGELYDRAGGARSELWYLPKASHTAALKQYPKAYEQRVVSFFKKNL
jgi:pimeloyl-ACP methyl ester carboxylesterase